MKIKDYFYFQKSDRTIILILFAAISAAAIFISYFYKEVLPPPLHQKRIPPPQKRPIRHAVTAPQNNITPLPDGNIIKPTEYVPNAFPSTPTPPTAPLCCVSVCVRGRFATSINTVRMAACTANRRTSHASTVSPQGNTANWSLTSESRPTTPRPQPLLGKGRNTRATGATRCSTP